MIECDTKDCNARALVHVVLDTGYSLAFCGHHMEANEVALSPYELTAHRVDERHQLTQA